MLLEDTLLGRSQHPVESAQHSQGQDHLPVLRLFVVAPQQVGDGPNKRGVVASGCASRPCALVTIDLLGDFLLRFHVRPWFLPANDNAIPPLTTTDWASIGE